MSVDSFDEHIGGAVNLMNLCLLSPKSSQPTFFFSSSIAARLGSGDAFCAEDFPTSPATAASTGYARSKWVTEKLCERVAQSTSINVGVLRIGQLVGDTVKCGYTLLSLVEGINNHAVVFGTRLKLGL